MQVRDGGCGFTCNTVDGRNPFRTTLKPWETIIGWYLQKNTSFQGFSVGANRILSIHSMWPCNARSTCDLCTKSKAPNKSTVCGASSVLGAQARLQHLGGLHQQLLAKGADEGLRDLHCQTSSEVSACLFGKPLLVCFKQQKQKGPFNFKTLLVVPL